MPGGRRRGEGTEPLARNHHRPVKTALGVIHLGVESPTLPARLRVYQFQETETEKTCPRTKRKTPQTD